MRAVVQRVSKAKVTIGNRTSGEIGDGLLILVGIETKDSEADGEWLSRKIVNLRIFADEDGNMNRSILDVGGNVLLVSQFTLHGKTKKGNRPSFIEAARPEYAIPLYEKFIEQLENEMGNKIETGEFGAMMNVSLTNDGPVTLIIDTQNKE